MRQRGLRTEEVYSVIQRTKPFRYFHEGVWKTGYYDPVTRIFVGQVGDTITTVMARVNARYIESIKGEMP